MWRKSEKLQSSSFHNNGNRKKEKTCEYELWWIEFERFLSIAYIKWGRKRESFYIFIVNVLVVHYDEMNIHYIENYIERDMLQLKYFHSLLFFHLSEHYFHRLMYRKQMGIFVYFTCGWHMEFLFTTNTIYKMLNL
jgi:hypothetical protein